MTCKTLVGIAALILITCSSGPTRDRHGAAEHVVESEDEFVAVCRPSQAMVILGLWRGTFESGDFIFPDTLGFAAAPGPFAKNPASKTIVLGRSADSRDRRMLAKAPRNGVGGWSFVWRAKLVVDSNDCSKHISVRHILDLTPIDPKAYDDLYRRSQDH